MADTPLITLMGTALDGGIGRNLLNLSKGFVQQGCRVDLVLNDLSGPYIEQLDPRVKLYRIPTDHSLSGIPWLLRYFYRQRPEAVLTPNVRLTVLACRAVRLTRTRPRVFVNVHSTYSVKFQQLTAQKRSKRINRILDVYPRCCTGIICVSKGVADDLAENIGLSRDILKVISNPVDVAHLQMLAKEPVAHPWFDPSQFPVIVSVGRIIESKNIELLIESFNLLRAETLARLVIIGDGPHIDACRQLAANSAYSEDIAFLGHQSNPWQFMARSKVFVLSSNVEGAPNILIEAMAVGTPVVSTDCPHGPREVLQGGRYGALVPMEDPVKLATAIHRILEREGLETRQFSLREAVGRFELDRIAQQYLNCFGISVKQ